MKYSLFCLPFYPRFKRKYALFYGVLIFVIFYSISSFGQKTVKTLQPKFFRPFKQFIELGDKLVSIRNQNDVRVLVRKIKLHQEIFDALYQDPSVNWDSDVRNRMLGTLNNLEIMYPYDRIKNGSVWQLYSSFKGRGIVMATGNKHFKYALHAIIFMRKLDCKLPIEVFYNGKDDLDMDKMDVLSRQEGVRLRDASGLISPLLENSIGGWSIKPFAMLMSSFQEFIFVDADVLFFQNPELLFTSPSYVETGTLYFRDRTIWTMVEAPLGYLKLLVDEPSEYSKTQRLWLGQSPNEQESGVIVMDKRRGGMFVLLMATMLNMAPFSEVLYIYNYGDKESYWISSEALNVPYRWAPGAGSAVGYPNPKTRNSICGQLLHVDEEWKPLWFNGGVVMNKNKKIGREMIMNITHFAIDSTYKNLEWYESLIQLIFREWETESHPFCLKPENPDTDIGELSHELREIAYEMIYEWLKLDLPLL